MQIPIVDANDIIIAYKDRSELDFDKDIFRTASLWVVNSNGDVLLSQRKLTKRKDPGKWSEAVGGTVEGDDTYLKTISREAKEELGLENTLFVEGPKKFVTTKSYRGFVQWYTLCMDKGISDFNIQEDEIEQVAWVPIKQLQDDVRNFPDKYIESMSGALELFGN